MNPQYSYGNLLDDYSQVVSTETIATPIPTFRGQIVPSLFVSTACILPRPLSDTTIIGVILSAVMRLKSRVLLSGDMPEQRFSPGSRSL
ncbi:hypothetical protein AcV5_007783 [Taiwanofungus camphoratus]|nr:hypothetical protein AcV5_007783 [Antrodia cinnamomea]